MPRTLPIRYGFALTAVLATLLMKGLVERWVGKGPPLIHFFPAVTLAAWFGGIGPGLLSTLASALIVCVLYFPPIGSLATASANDRYRLGLFVFEGGLTSFLMGVLHAARRSSEIHAAEARRYRDTLRESEERFRSLSACSPVGIFLSDIQGQCTYVNPRCQEIFGISFEESVGDGWACSILDEDRGRVLDAWAHAAANGEPSYLEYRVRRGDGTVRWVHDRASPLISDRGIPIGHVGTVEDVTERRRGEDEVRRQRDFAEGLIGTAQVIVLVLDRRGRVVRHNPFLETLIDVPDLTTGQDWFETFVPDTARPEARSAFEDAWAAEGSQVVHPIRGRDGREHEVEWTLRTLPGVVGDLPNLLVIGHDLTALREAQGRAVQSERLAAIGEMVTGLAHESRNALQRGQACLEMLALRIADRPEAIDLLHGIEEAQEDLHRLYEEVRDYAAPIVLETRPCSLRDVLHDAWSRLETARRGRRVELLEDGIEDLRCRADPFRMSQVFRNVLDNALAAAHDPVRIAVAWDVAEVRGRAAIAVAIRDNGSGLAPSQRDRLFVPFYTTKTQGTGLGMPISRRIVEAHGGLIAAAPDDGEGTTIVITLPRGTG